MAFILEGISWMANDPNIVNPVLIGDEIYEGEYLNKQEFLNYMSVIPMQWQVSKHDYNHIILGYPSIDRSGRFAISRVPYNIRDLPTAMEVIGAIAGWYQRPLTSEEKQSFNNYRKIKNPKKIDLLEGHVQFQGLHNVAPGVYNVLLK